MGTYPALIVSREQTNEPPAIRGINEATFNRPDEADLVDGLRNDGAVLLSLVAELEKRVVGHILFSRMWLDGDGGAIRAAALTPVAVLPDHQRPGVRERLIRTGLDSYREQSEQVVFVLGIPTTIRVFGFSTEKGRPLVSPFPSEAFMALELVPRALNGIREKVRYPDASASNP